MSIPSQGLRHGLALSLLGALLGCALAPGMPAGPIAHPGVHLPINYMYAYAPSTVRAIEPAGTPHRFHGNSAMYGATFPSPIFPAHAGLRVAPSRSLDFGLDAGLQETGLQLRAGPLDATRALPWGVELEWRTGVISLLKLFDDRDQDLGPIARRNLLRVRGELYPPLPLGQSEDGIPYTFGVLSLGVSAGRELASIASVPRAFDEVEEGPWSAEMLGLRWESRLEGAIGAQVRTPGDHRYTLMVMPWLVLYQGELRERRCDGCSLQLVDIESSAGVALAIGGSWQLE